MASIGYRQVHPDAFTRGARHLKPDGVVSISGSLNGDCGPTEPLSQPEVGTDRHRPSAASPITDMVKAGCREHPRPMKARPFGRIDEGVAERVVDRNLDASHREGERRHQIKLVRSLDGHRPYLDDLGREALGGGHQHDSEFEIE